jgi:hypothetical protein
VPTSYGHRDVRRHRFQGELDQRILRHAENARKVLASVSPMYFCSGHPTHFCSGVDTAARTLSRDIGYFDMSFGAMPMLAVKAGFASRSAPFARSRMREINTASGLIGMSTKAQHNHWSETSPHLLCRRFATSSGVIADVFAPNRPVT